MLLDVIKRKILRVRYMVTDLVQAYRLSRGAVRSHDIRPSCVARHADTPNFVRSDHRQVLPLLDRFLRKLEKYKNPCENINNWVQERRGSSSGFRTLSETD